MSTRPATAHTLQTHLRKSIDARDASRLSRSPTKKTEGLLRSEDKVKVTFTIRFLLYLHVIYLVGFGHVYKQKTFKVEAMFS